MLLQLLGCRHCAPTEVHLLWQLSSGSKQGDLRVQGVPGPPGAHRHAGNSVQRLLPPRSEPVFLADSVNASSSKGMVHRRGDHDLRQVFKPWHRHEVDDDLRLLLSAPLEHQSHTLKHVGDLVPRPSHKAEPGARRHRHLLQPQGPPIRCVHQGHCCPRVKQRLSRQEPPAIRSDNTQPLLPARVGKVNKATLVPCPGLHEGAGCVGADRWGLTAGIHCSNWRESSYSPAGCYCVGQRRSCLLRQPRGATDQGAQQVKIPGQVQSKGAWNPACQHVLLHTHAP